MPRTTRRKAASAERAKEDDEPRTGEFQRNLIQPFDCMNECLTGTIVKRASIPEEHDSVNAIHADKVIIDDLEQELLLREEALELKRQRFELSRLRKSQGSACAYTTSGRGASIAQNSELNLLVSSLKTLELPKIEIDSFDGSPENYTSFMSSFEMNIASRLTSNRQKLSYLTHYCRGPAKEAIKHCCLLSEDKCYEKALALLKDNFGQPYLIAQNMTKSLFQGPPVNHDLAGLQAIIRQMTSCLVTLRELNRSADLDSTILLVKLVERLPKPIQTRWAEVVQTVVCAGRDPGFEDLLNLVETRAAIMNSDFGKIAFVARKSESSREASRPHRVGATNVHDSCQVCGEGHAVHSCPKFLGMQAHDRRRLVMQRGLCFVCLKKNHRAQTCTSKANCIAVGCRGRHHALLHEDRPPKENPTAMETPTTTCGATSRKQHLVHLGFVPVLVRGPLKTTYTYAFLDNGSDTSLVSEELARTLGIQHKLSKVNVQTLHGNRPVECGKTSVEIQSLDGSSAIDIENAFVVKRLPVQNIDRLSDHKCWSHLADIHVESIDRDTVGLLLGCDVPEAHRVLDQRWGNHDEPFAIRSPLGWVIRGPSRRAQGGLRINAVKSSTDDLLSRMYNAEFVDLKDPEEPASSLEDEQALSIVSSSAKLEGNHYSLAIPWKPSAELPRGSRAMAYKRLMTLKKQLQGNETLRKKYVDHMKDHLNKGYIRKVADDDPNDRWFLPHHVVRNARKPEKMRVVFDCAAAVNGVSLNDTMLQGPDWTNKLTGVLLRFRQCPIAVTADIKEMFLQVRLKHEDRKSFSFLWWDEGNLEASPRVFEWNSHPFGAKSSPFCANFALRKAAEDHAGEFRHEAIEAIRKCFYVDDFLSSVETIEEAKVLVAELREILRRGGFHLTKWATNRLEVLTDIQPDDRAEVTRVIDNRDEFFKTLGLIWNSSRDSFSFPMSHPLEPATRRGCLKYIASVFDPVGFIAPVLLQGKVILQNLCRERVGWDSPLSGRHKEDWSKWIMCLRFIEDFEIKRCIRNYAVKPVASELHVFSDASEVGYGASAYVRNEYADGSVQCAFLMGKSRVAPLKVTTIPRLELTAAVLSATLANHLITETDVEFRKTVLWTDSEITLRYIANTSARFATFVANRVRRIRELTEVDQWRYVPTKENPADIASRGLSSKLGAKMKLWIESPPFLWKSEESWPTKGALDSSLEEQLELKRVAATMLVNVETDWLGRLADRCRDWTTLQRRVAVLTRFKKFLVHKHRRESMSQINCGPLHFNEIKESGRNIVRLVQKASIKKQDVRRLKPIESDGMLHVGGRTATLLPILPSKGRITELIVQHYHAIEGHSGPTAVLGVIRRSFWIVKGMTAVKSALAKCVTCRVQLAAPCQQVMAPLPSFRLEPSGFPFKHCGLDYFGPFLVKVGRTRAKRFGCLFTCMQTRAVHIEVASELSTSSFLMALTRFVCRRGPPEVIYSDNGTNFVGAERELRKIVVGLDQRRISGDLAAHEIEWKFNPPSASHRGGAWERLIRSIRRILGVVVKEQLVAEDVLVTGLAEAERILNNRPLVPVYDDPDRPDVLTPNDLILLRRNTGLVDDELTLTDRLTRGWRQAQCMANQFWKRWQREYLPTLQRTQKWLKTFRDLRQGDLVLIRKPNEPRGTWSKGVVAAAQPGCDGHVRTVLVRTSNGILTRDIRSVCLLEGVLEESQ